MQQGISQLHSIILEVEPLVGLLDACQGGLADLSVPVCNRQMISTFGSYRYDPSPKAKGADSFDVCAPSEEFMMQVP